MKTRQQLKAEALKKATDMLRLQRKALTTEQCYLHWIGSFIDWLFEHGRDMPDSRTRIEAYLTALAHRRVSASTQNQAFNAIKYYYNQVRCETVEGIDALRASRPRTHRTALSREDTLALLDRIRDVAGYPTRLVSRLLYGCGLRVSEPLNLRIKDIDAPGSRLIIRGAKGGKDRMVIVPCSLMPEIQEQIQRARVVWQADQLRKMPVEVPGELARKYKNAPFSWQWAWLFPSHQPCDHPRTGERVRYRMHECNVQRAVKDAAKSLDLDSLATPHILRHCWATHVIDGGAAIRDVQELMGHSSLETTMGYVRPHPGRVPSLL
jgi:site-specific recombinase XerD